MSTHRSDTQRGLYRSRSGAIFGVCRGLSDYFDFSVFWIRFAAVVLLLMTGLWPILGIYLIAALIMKPEAARPFASDDERAFYDSYVGSRRAATEQLRQRFGHLERRIRNMEDAVTSKEYDWDRRFNAS